MKILNRTAIKMEAKSFIMVDNKWLKMFLPCLIIYILNGNYVTISRTVDSFEFFGSEVVTRIQTMSNASMILSLLLMPFLVAISGYYLNFIRGFNPQWNSLFKEGFSRFGSYFVTQLLVRVFTFLWLMLLIIPGIIMSIAYSQSKYIIHDNPNLTASQAIKMSKIMTKGFKSDLFIMNLSFVLWYLLTIPTFGLSLFFVIPYVETTSAMFYENLKKFSIDSKKIAPEAFGMISIIPPINDFEENDGFGGYQSR